LLTIRPADDPIGCRPTIRSVAPRRGGPPAARPARRSPPASPARCTSRS